MSCVVVLYPEYYEPHNPHAPWIWAAMRVALDSWGGVHMPIEGLPSSRAVVCHVTEADGARQPHPSTEVHGT